MADSYQHAFETGARPVSFDKDFVRAWVAERCDPYKDEIPQIPEELVLQTSRVYMEAYERITGQTFKPNNEEASPLDRVRRNLEPYFPGA